MTNNIENIKYDAFSESVFWGYNGRTIAKPFKGDVLVYEIKKLNEVLIVADSNFNGPKNVFIFSANGDLRLNPDMPKMKTKVYGVYSIWYVEGKLQVEAILLCDDFKPYDTGCTFDILGGAFSNFHPSK